jgi:hypothetical protein
MSDDFDRTADKDFADLAGKYLDDIAPDFKCSVCGNESFVVEYEDDRKTTPVVYRYNPDSKLRTYRKVWLCVCARCGNTYTFHRSFLESWAKSKS